MDPPAGETFGSFLGSLGGDSRRQLGLNQETDRKTNRKPHGKTTRVMKRNTKRVTNLETNGSDKQENN